MFFFFFKQKTAYEMRISDWSSDVCSSDLLVVGRKGSGKSAVFFRVRDKISSSRRNIVLDLKPDGYQLVKLKDRVLKAMDQGTQEHTITAFWHCVLILEIAKAALHLDKSTHRLDEDRKSTRLNSSH